MEECSYLEVDVNGQEIFLVDKKITASFSNKFTELFRKKVSDRIKNFKVIFNDFPGGAKGFELIARFCYNNGRIEITPSNIFILNSAAIFMEMSKEISETTPNLIYQTEKSLLGINFWTWSEMLSALKQCQDLYPFMKSSTIYEKFNDSFVERLSWRSVTGSYTSSDGSSIQFSCDTNSIDSEKNRPTWWFNDLLFLNIDFIDKIVKTMLTQNFDHVTISKFLFNYQRSKTLVATRAEKRKITKLLIDLLSSLNANSISIKGLFDVFRAASNLRIPKRCVTKLENLIGSMMDQATIDDLIVRPSREKHYAYDVDLISRLVKFFLLEKGTRVFSSRLKKVGSLMDLYVAEVAPDYHLKPSKFAALAMALPDSARDCFDGLYRAIDIYLKVHPDLQEEQKLRVCCALNHDKLSLEALEHLAENLSFSLRRDARKFNIVSGNEKNGLNYEGRQPRMINSEKLSNKIQRKSTIVTNVGLRNSANVGSLSTLCS